MRDTSFSKQEPNTHLEIGIVLSHYGIKPVPVVVIQEYAIVHWILVQHILRQDGVETVWTICPTVMFPGCFKHCVTNGKVENAGAIAFERNVQVIPAEPGTCSNCVDGGAKGILVPACFLSGISYNGMSRF